MPSKPRCDWPIRSGAPVQTLSLCSPTSVLSMTRSLPAWADHGRMYRKYGGYRPPLAHVVDHFSSESESDSEYEPSVGKCCSICGGLVLVSFGFGLCDLLWFCHREPQSSTVREMTAGTLARKCRIIIVKMGAHCGVFVCQYTVLSVWNKCWNLNCEQFYLSGSVIYLVPVTILFFKAVHFDIIWCLEVE